MMNRRDIVPSTSRTRRKRVLTGGSGTDDALPRLFAGRPRARVQSPTTRSARSTTRAICALRRSQDGRDARALAPRLDRQVDARAIGARRARAAVHRRGPRPRRPVPAARSRDAAAADAGRTRRLDRRLRAVARRRRDRVRPRERRASAGAVRRAAATAAASARSSRSTARCSRGTRSARCANSRSRAGTASRCRCGSPIRRTSIRRRSGR